MNRQTGGVVLAVAGFVFLVGAFRGTWRQTIDALLGTDAAGAAPVAGGSKTPTSTTGSNLPGTSVIPGSSGNPLASAGR